MSHQIPPDDLVTLCCDLLFEAQTDWVTRRKESVELVSERLLRHRLSVDLSVETLSKRSVGGSDLYDVPLTLLRKEPAAFTKFDLVDDTGRSLSLPTKAANAAVSAAVLRAAAERVLGHRPSDQLSAEFRLIAAAPKDEALAIVHGAYRDRQGWTATDADAGDRAVLWGHERYQWLLVTLAFSSIAVICIKCESGRPHRIVKLSYDEFVIDVAGIRTNRVRACLASLSGFLGWRPYRIQVFSPFVGAKSYHFELHVPPGATITDAGLFEEESHGEGDARRHHRFIPDARLTKSSVGWAAVAVHGDGFLATAAITLFAVLVSIGAAIWQAPVLVDATTSGPALLLLFPGLVGAYLARPVDAWVSRVLRLARSTLVLGTFAAYAAAGRLAIISKDHPSTVESLRTSLWIALGVAAACALSLLIAWTTSGRYRD